MRFTNCVRSADVSIVIPARNEAHRLPLSLEKILCHLDRTDYCAEVIVVDNGSVDGTSEIVHRFSRQHQQLQIQLLSEPKVGKGAAVRTGMLHAKGNVLFLCDADLSMPFEDFEKLRAQISSGADIAVGSREDVGAKRVGEPIQRWCMGRLFNAFARTLGLTELCDTQCGFKAFRRHVAHDVFAAQLVDGWAFDIEILLIAVQRGYSVASVPINWNFDVDSRVRPFRDSIAMLRETTGIYSRLRRGLYDQPRETQVPRNRFSLGR